MKARAWKQEDIGQLKQWVGYHEMPVDALLSDILPNTGGFIVDGLGCVFLYITNSSLAYIDNMFINPKAPFDQRRIAGKLLIDAMIEHAKSHNVRLVSL